MSLKVLDLFSGIGGFSLGLERAGMETVAFCEIDKKARMVLKKHWPNVPIFEDVSQLTAEKLNEQEITVDVICGGFPCQDISLAGRGAGIEGKRSGLWSEFARLIGELRPQFAIVENVSALLNRGLDRVLGDLSEIGYDAEWHCIPASAVGAPHQRDRIWILAYPNSNGKWSGDGPEQSERHTTGECVGDSGELERNGLVAYSSSARLSERGRSEQQTGNQETATGMVAKFERCGTNVADTYFAGLQRDEWCWTTGAERQPAGYIAQCSWWAIEPDVGRMAHGVSGRVDRLKQLGNAVVPQIPEMLGRMILEKIKK